MSEQQGISASVGVHETYEGWVVYVAVMDGAGHELHTFISQPKTSEEAHHEIGGQKGACERLGIPASLTESAKALREWWSLKPPFPSRS